VELGLLLLPVLGLAVWVSLNVRVLGYRFDHISEIEQDYVMGVLVWFVLAAGILLLGGKSRRILLIGWIGKFFVTLVAMLFYEYYYGLDAGGYHELARTGYHAWYPGHNFWHDVIPSFSTIRTGEQLEEQFLPEVGAGNENALRFMLMVSVITGPFYHAMKVGCAFLGLLGIWWFYRGAVVAMGRERPFIFYLLAFFPSVIFWSSILGKDPVLFLFLSIYAYGGAVWFVQGLLSSVWYIGVGLLGLSLIRPWMGAMALVALGLATLLAKARAWQANVALLLFVPAILLGVRHFIPADVLENPAVLSKYFLDIPMGLARSGGSGTDPAELTALLEGGAGASAASLPLAMLSGLFRPLPFDAKNPFIALAALENTIVICLLLAAVLHFRFIYLRDPLTLWPLLYVLFWASLYGLIVMANFGAGVRYKLQMWPFLLLLLISLTHRDGRRLLVSRIEGSSRPISDIGTSSSQQQ
jgi:hypothetical protein